MAKYKDIKDFFKVWLGHINFDKKFYEQLKRFRLEWSTKSDEYIEFLGSNLIGVHNIRFSNLDDEHLMYDIYKIKSIEEMQKDVYNVPGVEKKFKIGSNIIYLTLAYTAHRLLTNKTLPQKLREDGVIESMLIMQYRMFSSLYSHYFKYNVSENIAHTVYQKLSHKFILKQLGNWYDVFLYRAKTVLDKKNPNYVRLIKFNTQDAIRIVTDTQTKLRTSLIIIYKVLVETLEEGKVIEAESSTFVGGEKNEKQVKDMDHLAYHLINYLQQIKYNPYEFIDTNLVKIIDTLFTTINETLILQGVRCLPNKDLHKKVAKSFSFLKNEKDPFDFIIKEIVEINIEYLQRYNINLEDRRNIPNMLVMLRHYWSSSKVKNPRMNSVKNYLQKFSMICTGKKTKWMIVTLAIALSVYIFMRSLKKD